MSKQYYRFLIILFFVNNVFAGGFTYAYTKTYELKKDEVAWFYVSLKGEEKWEKYAFSWTHFDNTNLILFTNYKKYTRQYVLSLRRKLDYAKESLLANYTNPSIDKAWLFLEFKDFKDNKAKIRILVVDDLDKIDIDFNKFKEIKKGK